jgi:hypothetical protein
MKWKNPGRITPVRVLVISLLQVREKCMVPLVGGTLKCISQWRMAYYSRVMPKYQLIIENRDKKLEKHDRFVHFLDAKNTLNLP